MLAGLVVPFVFGHYWSRITAAAATAAIVVRGRRRLVLFALTPTMYGVENTLLYIPNEAFGPASTVGRRSSRRSVAIRVRGRGARHVRTYRGPAPVENHPRGCDGGVI